MKPFNEVKAVKKAVRSLLARYSESFSARGPQVVDTIMKEQRYSFYSHLYGWFKALIEEYVRTF